MRDKEAPSFLRRPRLRLGYYPVIHFNPRLNHDWLAVGLLLAGHQLRYQLSNYASDMDPGRIQEGNAVVLGVAQDQR